VSIRFGLCAAIMASVVLPVPALADDPKDPAMMTPEALARDREMIRKLNEDMLRQVTERDARFAQNRRAYRDLPRKQAEYDRRYAEYEREQARYAENSRNYEQAMADWRADVAACRAGQYSRCN